MNVEEIFLKRGAIHFSFEKPFTWASGIESPVYCDNRKLISYPKDVKFLTKELSKIILKHFSGVQALAGTATAGIPWSSFLSYEMNLPNSYIRGGTSKGHGLKKQVEGDLKPGAKVVIVEDLVSTGKSSLEAYHAAKDFGLEVLGIMSLMTYGLEQSKSAFKKQSIQYHSLTNIHQVMDYAVKAGDIEKEKATALDGFLDKLNS